VRTQIGSYRIDETIAVGGMGVVYRAWDEALGRPVAIKTFRRDLPIASELRERLVREAKAHGLLKHDNIVTIYTMDDDDGELFLVMEYLDGATLEATLTALPDGRMAVGDALPLFYQLLDALEFIHANGIVHRDLKPSNVMICGDRVKVIDFGIALLSGMPRLTSSLTLLGTPAYMSPEQLEGKDVDRRSDIYSAALVLYRMLTGRDAFTAKEYLAQVHERLLGAREPSSIVPELPPGVCAALAKAMSHDPADRFRSAADFRDALRGGDAGFLHLPENEPEKAQHDEPADPPVPPPDPKPYVWRMVLIGVCGLGAVVALVLQLRQPVTTLPPPRVTRPSIVYQPPPLPQITVTQAPATKPNPGGIPISPPPPPPQETEAQRAERQRRELEALRKEIDGVFPAIEADIRIKDFTSATHRLDDVASRVQPHAGELWQEFNEVQRLRDAVRNGIADVERVHQQEALWESHAADLEALISAGQFAEAKGIAEKRLKDPTIPPPLVVRIQRLQQQAREGLTKVWTSTTVGPTTNSIRKSSSPPRK